MDLSIVLVNWNTKDLLLRCLQTIQEDTRSLSTEIIVVDNASSDGSVSAVRQQFPSVRIVENETNQGFARANNIGIGLAHGNYVCLINSDVELIPECLPRMFHYMEDHRKIGILGPRVLNSDLTLQPSCKNAPTLWTTFCRAAGLDTLLPNSEFFASEQMVLRNLNRIRAVDIVSGCFWMVRAKALSQVGGLDETYFMYSEDKDWCVRFWKAGWQVVYFPEAQAIHFGGSSSSSDPLRFSVEMCRANLQYWKKHHGAIVRMTFGLLLLVHHFLRLIGGVGFYLLRPSKRQAAQQVISRSLACSSFLVGLR
jgi:GT2 family glycosyltransferase